MSAVVIDFATVRAQHPQSLAQEMPVRVIRSLALVREQDHGQFLSSLNNAPLHVRYAMYVQLALTTPGERVYSLEELWSALYLSHLKHIEPDADTFIFK